MKDMELEKPTRAASAGVLFPIPLSKQRTHMSESRCISKRAPTGSLDSMTPPPSPLRAGSLACHGISRQRAGKGSLDSHPVPPPARRLARVSRVMKGLP